MDSMVESIRLLFLQENSPHFRHFPACLDTSRVRVGPLINFASRKATVIFQKVGADWEHQDGKRLQVVGEAVPAIHRKSYDHVTTYIHDLIHAVDPSLNVSPASVILSKPGCMAQSYHADYDFDIPESKQSLFILVGLMPSRLHFIEIIDDKSVQKLLNYSAGDIVVCRGDFIHAGAGYDDNNIRLHFYVDPPRSPHTAPARTVNKTYIFDDDAGFFTFAYYTMMNNFLRMCNQMSERRRRAKATGAAIRAAKKAKRAQIAPAPIDPV